MARMHGRRGRVYMGLASDTAVAVPVAFLSEWEINFGTEKADVSAMGDNGRVTVSGLPAQTGSFRGWYDDATVQTYSAAQDGLPRKFYLYPSTLNVGQYWFGMINPDFTVSGGVTVGVAISSAWEAYSDILKVG